MSLQFSTNRQMSICVIIIFIKKIETMSLLSYKDLRNGQMMRLGLFWESLQRKIFFKTLTQHHEKTEALEEWPTKLDRVKCTTPSKEKL